MQDCQSRVDVLSEARRLIAAKISVIPIRTDGSKRPALMTWKPYQTRLPVESEIEAWFGRGSGKHGLAVVCGAVSGNVECLDFDCPSAWDQWKGLLDAEIGIAAIKDCAVVSSPRPGVQLWYRGSAIAGGNHVLARMKGQNWLSMPIIETRGEGGYGIVPPSPGECHPSGRPYRLISGDLANLPILTNAVIGVLKESAAALNTWVPPVDHVTYRSPSLRWKLRSVKENRVGDLYNQKASWSSLLSKHGWTKTREMGPESHWRRPGKKGPGISATLGVVPDCLYVFSSNAAPLLPNRIYDKFGAYAAMEFDYDFSAAAKSLVELGYGEKDDLDTVGSMQYAVGSSDNDQRSTKSDQRIDEEKRRFPLLSLSQIVALPPPVYQIEGILYEESLVEFFGPPSAGKSLVCLDLALSLCFGLDHWFGHRIRKTGPVVWINADGGRGITRRIQAWLAMHGRSGKTPKHPFYTLMGGIRLNRPEEMRPFREQLQELPGRPGLVVVDTLSRCLPGVDENSHKDMTTATQLCHQLKMGTGASILLIHHTGRSGQDRGSSVIPAEVDLQARLFLEPGGRNGFISCIKSREGELFRPFSFEIRRCGESVVAVDPNAGSFRVQVRRDPYG